MSVIKYIKKDKQLESEYEISESNLRIILRERADIEGVTVDELLRRMQEEGLQIVTPRAIYKVSNN